MDNYVAYGLVKVATLHVIDRVWMKEILSCICDVRCDFKANDFVISF
jgi:hypothetical protein